MDAERAWLARALDPLKDFQRRTVDYVFERFYGADDPVRQFLVADEVGLGKTMVARGVIARTIDYLWNRVPRIDVLYICSNHAIAAQNINRLNVLGRKELALPTRMTLLPLQLRGAGALESNKVNFISLTPGTTFSLRSSTGVTRERALLRHLLHDLVSYPRGLHNMLQVGAGAEPWNAEVDELTLEGIDQRIIDRFQHEVAADVELFDELERVCALFPRRRTQYPLELTQPRNVLIGRLRARLSHACVDALEPDLIILDEFQRFRYLLHGDDDAALLARELFNYTESDGHGARTLLLSATPYRMLTLQGDDADAGDNYEDFLETVKFLYGPERGPEVTIKLARDMRAFRKLLYSLPQTRQAAVDQKTAVETCLRGVISRTERVASTAKRDSMVCQPRVEATVEPADLVQAAAIEQLALTLGAPGIVEYWKSAPYLLNFMRHYMLKKKLAEQAEHPSAALCEALKAAAPTLLEHDAIDAYRPLELANGRLRAVADDVFSDGLDQHLWLPPSLPYYGNTRSKPPLTKALIFSAWSMVPDAIAALLSYEAERRADVGTSGRRYFEQHRLRVLQFGKDQERLTGLRALMLLYPSPTLAELGDPLAEYATHSSQLSWGEMRVAIAACLVPALENLQRTSEPADQDGTSDDWAAPAVLDELMGTAALEWLERRDGLRALTEEDIFDEHVAALARRAREQHIGRLPEDLPELLVDLALGSPAICAQRALKRVAPELAWDDHALLGAAARVAWAFRTLVNQPDAIALLRRDTGNVPYWRRVLTYGGERNLQSVLDEYANYLVDAEGLRGHPAAERVAGVAAAMFTALSIRPSQIDMDDPRVENGAVTIGRFQMRGRFAMRLNGDNADEESAAVRTASVRNAFNSPFRPFVLATTSVGQEGLDFHPYCYRVYHWNLPGNPVDLEQREGRIHRFKSHAIRLNLAEKQAAAIRGNGTPPDDPWDRMFECADAEATHGNGIIPYWIYEGSVKVERRVPMLPFSRELTRLQWLKRSLTVYRLAFGQPRQDDLLAYLQSLGGKGIDDAAIVDLQIRLEPPGSR